MEVVERREFLSYGRKRLLVSGPDLETDRRSVQKPTKPVKSE